jgi:cytochrome P450
MAKFPDIQKKAQAEIFRVIGSSRLPTYDDRASLPYIEALYREVLRWKPPVPLNTAHVTTEADIYNGLHIPKGSTFSGSLHVVTFNHSYHRRSDCSKHMVIASKCIISVTQELNMT